MTVVDGTALVGDTLREARKALDEVEECLQEGDLAAAAEGCHVTANVLRLLACMLRRSRLVDAPGVELDECERCGAAPHAPNDECAGAT